MVKDPFPSVGTNRGMVSVSAMTQNYIVFLEQPMKLDYLKILELPGQPIYPGLSWAPDLGTVFHVISKHTGKVRARELHRGQQPGVLVISLGFFRALAPDLVYVLCYTSVCQIPIK